MQITIIRFQRSFAASIAAIFILVAIPIASAALPSFTGLGKFSGDNSSYAYGISDDGSTVVGASYTNPNVSGSVIRAFRWTASTGMASIGDLPGGSQVSVAYDVSADGSVIAGHSSSALSYSHHPVYNEPFRWTASGGMSGLGYIPGTNGQYGSAHGVSGNGQVVVGSSTGNNGAHPFRWTTTAGMSNLGDLDNHDGGNQDYASGINFDGTAIVGMAAIGYNRTAFRWTPGSGMQSLGTLPGAAYPESFASDVSANGNVVVGSGNSADGGIQAFRWTPTTGMTGLGYLPGGRTSSDAAAVSADGLIIVGTAINAANASKAVRWDPLLGIQSIQDLLIASGLGPALTGWQLTHATGISADGQTISGWGNSPTGIQGWVATIPRAEVVPEPSSFALGICGSLAVVAVVRRRSRRAAPAA